MLRATELPIHVPLYFHYLQENMKLVHHTFTRAVHFWKDSISTLAKNKHYFFIIQVCIIESMDLMSFRP
jgi:hypothetical protein